MSERQYIVCDSCRRTLHLPTTPELAAGWQRLSFGVGKPFKHHCGECDPTALIKRMEQTEGE